MAKAWMFSGVSRNPSAILSLLFPGGRAQTASWCTNTWHQTQLLLPLPSIVQENSFLGFFPLGAVGFDQGAVGGVSLKLWLR